MHVDTIVNQIQCMIHKLARPSKIIFCESNLILELSRAHTPRVNAASDLYPGVIDLHLKLEYADDLYLHKYCCAHEQKTHGQHAVNRHGKK